MLKLVSESAIQEMEQDQQTALDNMLQAQLTMKSEVWKDKEAWLSVFAITLSPRISCKRAGVTQDRYRRWRKTCPQFCRMLNEIIKEASDEMVGSALNRATGYLVANDATESGFEEDAEGKVIRHGASDSLVRTFMGVSSENRQVEGVSININVTALGGDETTARAIGQNHKHITVDGEYVDVDSQE